MSEADFTTHDLVAAAQCGDEQALQELLYRSGPQLRRYAKRQCASDDVEEAVQDALWVLYRRVDALRAIGAFSAWLFQIIRRECLRRARRRHPLIDLEQCELAGLVGERPSDEELRIDLKHAISKLPQHYREILILRDIGGYSSEEAATSLDIPVGAAKSRLHRARQMLRSQLAGPVRAGCV
ncbi:MAG TPA: sigma-70 family RNA polymerase sigma factor [Pyrinomonadaceae bacterium]|nr:sigma-70 family RNA polymerase sigma factor [Pyrinomonadaceae bacterium]